MAEDTGLGLSEFLEGTPSQETEETPPQEVAEQAGEQPKEEVTESPKEEKVETEEKPEEEKPKEETEEKPSSDWESEDNPFKKRYKDTADWANRVNQDNYELKRQNEEYQRRIERVERMQAGEWTEDDERQFAQGGQMSPDTIAKVSETGGRIVASRQAAIDHYGEETVNRTLFAPDAPFKLIENKPEVIQRVMNSPSPVVEAMKVVEEYSFRAKYGDTPKQWVDNLKKEYEKEIEDKVTKRVMENIKKSEAQPKGISEARGQASGAKQPLPKDTPLGEIFTNF